MASFLPFVSEETRTQNVVNSIVKSSKGLTSDALSIIISIVILRGVNELRELVSKQPAILTTSDALSNVATENQNLLVDTETVNLWSSALRILKMNKECKSEYKGIKEELFFSCLIKHKPEGLYESGFNIEEPLLVSIKNMFKDSVKTEDLKNIEYSEEGLPVGFQDKNELITLTAIAELRKQPITYVISPVRINTEDLDTNGTRYFCTAPILEDIYAKAQ